MSDTKTEHMNDHLSEPTSIFGLSLWIVLGVCVGAAFVLVLVLISLYLASKRSKNKTLQTPTIPIVSKEIRVDHVGTQIQAYPYPEPDPLRELRGKLCSSLQRKRAQLGTRKFTLILARTIGLLTRNGVGGGYGIVYHGVLEDKTHIAVKNLLNNKGQAEKEFKVEVEAIGRVRHKNLVRLLGFCAEGAHRMLVYEYVNNGNLEQWIHGDVGPVSPLSWEIRMNIILKTAKGLSYLHEGLEPKVIHRDIKSSNILLDKQWNAKVSDFGLAKLIGSERSYITTRVMGTFGYVAPEYASTGMLNERSDVYSFGILIMEIITGRNPVDYNQPPGEVNLVEWLKKMISNREPEKVLDPKLSEKPRSRALKKALLVALKCVDPNALKRPKMGHVVHMLEAEEAPFKDDGRSIRDLGCSDVDNVKDGLKEKWRHQEEKQ
ncbi:hypothetical protein M0R45_004489 [Rubus argutus]|uniref:non-specific serine/threonine protein kinase n=1 Tax=Rubus argutus TaxID=59490 RepID=A0AAW1YJW4_RUBAR